MRKDDSDDLRVFMDQQVNQIFRRRSVDELEGGHRFFREGRDGGCIQW